ncbi:MULTISPECIES: alpha/beta fold hydrolase [unclassified Achromobacter]|uniref:alpha/beta fold hydrolase n=1 Tax=unclassified Achromobacter TaxID=2626865 RepID=UPI001E450897|nr:MULTISPECIES: hypothetical protein [unclassified Achromobacter]
MKPVLIVQGTKDIQVSPQDAQLLRQANPRAELAMIAEANHVLKTVHTEERDENLAAYSHPGLPLAEGVLRTISTFILRNAGTTAVTPKTPPAGAK